MSYIGALHGKKNKANGGGYQILPMPVTQQPPVSNGGTTPAPGTAPAPASSDPLAGVMGLLDGEIMGIPIKYIAIGLAAWFFLKK